MDVYIYDKTIWNITKEGLAYRMVAPSGKKEGNKRGREHISRRNGIGDSFSS